MSGTERASPGSAVALIQGFSRVEQSKAQICSTFSTIRSFSGTVVRRGTIGAAGVIENGGRNGEIVLVPRAERAIQDERKWRVLWRID